MTRMRPRMKRIGEKWIVSDPLHPVLFRVIRVPLSWDFKNRWHPRAEVTAQLFGITIPFGSESIRFRVRISNRRAEIYPSTEKGSLQPGELRPRFRHRHEATVPTRFRASGRHPRSPGFEAS